MTTVSNYLSVSNTIGNMYQREKDIKSKVGNIISIISDAPTGMQNPTSNVILKNYNITEDQFQNGIDNPYDLINLTKNLNESAMSGFGYFTVDDFLEGEGIKVISNYADVSNIIGGMHYISESNIGEIFPRYLAGYDNLIGLSRSLSSIQTVLDYAVFQGCNSYVYLVGTHSTVPATRFAMDQEYDEATDTWPIVELLLQECEARGIDLWLTFYDPRFYEPGYVGVVEGELGLYGSNMWFKKWFASLAKLSVLNPRLKGIIWDDIGEYEFFQKTNVYSWLDGDGVPILTVDYCRDLYEGIKAENEAFKMLWVCYEPYDYWTHDIWAERMPYTDGLVYAIYRYTNIADGPVDPVHGNPIPFPLWADMTPEYLQKIYDEQKETIINNLLLPWQDFWYCLYVSGTSSGGAMSESILEAQIDKCMTDRDVGSIYYFTVRQDSAMYTDSCLFGDSGLECRKGLIVKSAFEETDYVPLYDLYERCNDTLDSLLDGKDPLTSMKIYSTQINPPLTGPGYDAPGTYVRNTDCWIKDVKGLTAMSPYHTGFTWAGGARACTLVTPRHVIGCAHSMMSIGFLLRFVDRNNNVYIREIVDIWGGEFLSGAPDPCLYAQYNINKDIMIGLLDDDLPSNIEYVSVFANDIEDYLPVVPYEVATVSMIGAGITQTHPDRMANVRNTTNIHVDWGLYACSLGMCHYVNSSIPWDSPLRIPFYNSPQSGDSGEPVFFIVNNELVLISHHYGATTGPSYHDVIVGINYAMKTLSERQFPQSPVYTLTEFDLTGAGKFR